MLQLKNTTPFAANLSVLSDEHGIDTLYINVKASFRVGREWTLADKQSPPQAEDVYWGEPVESSLKYASDYHTGKSGTDVAMIGHACAPEQREVTQLDVSLRVGAVSKIVRVFGDRVWRNGAVSAPSTFRTMPLVYERAFGGSVVKPESTVVEERNPVGTGFRGRRSAEEMEGTALPNLEDPQSLIRSIDDHPEPACFGFRAPNWQPRAGHAGTYDERWMRERAPYLPIDYDRRFANAASPGLICEGFLKGGEAVEIDNVHPAGKLQFNLPYLKLSARVDMGGVMETPEFRLETVLLEPDQLQVSLVWKASLACDKKVPKIREVNLGISR